VTSSEDSAADMLFPYVHVCFLEHSSMVASLIASVVRKLLYYTCMNK
jgi:hypothetical protein